MQIPLSFADTVIGEGGSTISYIRRSSGATVTVQETRGVPGEMTVEISGTASQVQTAQQLVQVNVLRLMKISLSTFQGETSCDYCYVQCRTILLKQQHQLRYKHLQLQLTIKATVPMVCTVLPIQVTVQVEVMILSMVPIMVTEKKGSLLPYRVLLYEFL